MKRNFKYLIWILPLIFAGCEKVIDVDLNEADPAIVIEGNLRFYPASAEVKISKTSSFFDTLPSEKVTDAVVTILSDKGERYFLYELDEGTYKLDYMKLNPGATYHLYVTAEDVVYEATSVLNPVVPIDSVESFYEDRYSFFDKGYYLNVFFNDPPETENYYRMRIYKNGLLKSGDNDIIVFNDRYVNGNLVEISLMNDVFQLEDTVGVELMSIDKNAYNYFKTFSELVNNNPGSAAPANPISNINNDALGYFSAWSSDLKTIIIKGN